MEMRLYLLSALEEWVGYDCYSRFVIEAESGERAREIAQVHGGDEVGRMGQPISFWTDASQTSCEELKPCGEEGIRCESFHAG